MGVPHFVDMRKGGGVKQKLSIHRWRRLSIQVQTDSEEDAFFVLSLQQL